MLNRKPLSNTGGRKSYAQLYHYVFAYNWNLENVFAYISPHTYACSILYRNTPVKGLPTIILIILLLC